MKKLFIIFAILCLAAPAMAADWNFYGSARMQTWSTDVDPDVVGVDSDTDTTWTQQSNSRIGATVKVNDQIGGAFEYGTGVNLRKLYGTYTFGNGAELLLGQTYSPASEIWYSGTVYDADGGLLGVGQFYTGRVPQIRFTMAGLRVALVEPNTSTAASAFAKAAIGEYFDEDNLTDPEVAALLDILDLNYDSLADELGVNVNTTLPKIEATYRFKADAFSVDVFGGYQTYEVEYDGQSWDFDSYVLGVGGGVNFGAFYANAGVHFGQNYGNYGIYEPKFNGVSLTDDMKIDDNGQEKDADCLGYLGVIGFNASEMLSIEAGYGHEEAEVDDSNNKTERDQYYLNCTVTIAPGFFIVPEVGMITNSQDASNAEPETFYWGAKWQINF